MSFTTTAKNTMLGAISPQKASLHSAFPGQTGASEISGGGYAKVAVTFNAASGAVRTLSASAVFNVPATTVGWCGLWDNTGTTFYGYSPNDGNPLEFIADISTDTIRSLSHGYSDGQTIVFYGDTCPSPLVEGQVYYARDCTTDTFKVAASAGGSPIDLTTAGGSACAVSKITLQVYGGVGTHTINTWSIGLPF